MQSVVLAHQVDFAGWRDAARRLALEGVAPEQVHFSVGAPDDLMQEVLPLLQCFAENITHAGPVSAGHQLKLLHNFVSLGFSAVLAEAAAAAQRAGVPAPLAGGLPGGA